uniref:Crp/Fnr family transcriptional regulator n=1 Tax=Chelativorans sp. YIM 93263 TaxID=2906648 RepID=UPI003083BBD9
MWIDLIGFVGTALTIITYSLTTIIPLRIFAIAANIVFLFYGVVTQSFPLIAMSGILLPLNGWRLYQMLQLIREVDVASRSDLSMEWLRNYGTMRRYAAGEVIFRKGDPAGEMLHVESGLFRLLESGIEFRSGAIVGELGLLSPGNARTQSLECVESGQVRRISYSDLKQLYFQNPQFGFFFLRLISERLFENAEKAKET